MFNGNKNFFKAKVKEMSDNNSKGGFKSLIGEYFLINSKYIQYKEFFICFIKKLRENKLGLFKNYYCIEIKTLRDFVFYCYCESELGEEDIKILLYSLIGCEFNCFIKINVELKGCE